MPANLENPAVVTGLEKVSFHSNPPKKAMPKNAQTTTQMYLSAGNQPRLIQGIRRRDGIGEDQDTIASIRY